MSPQIPAPDPAPVPRRAVLVATLAAPPPADPQERAAFLGELRRCAEVLEVRADLTGDLDPEPLRREFGGRLLYTLRSREEGGVHEGSPERRHERLRAAAGSYGLVDLEAERDLVEEVLEAVPEEARVVSWHGPPGDVVELEERFAALCRVPARLYKLVVMARTPGDAVAPLLLAAALGRDDVLAFAAGRGGTWTRFLAPRLGAAVVYGAAAPAAPGAPGQITVAELVRDYGLPDLPPLERLYGIVGDPVVSASLSPRLHNGAYRELGVPALYVPFETASLGDFWLDVVESDLFRRLDLPLAGLSVTVPHKRASLAVAGAYSPLVETVGAANTLVLHDGVWEAEATDPAGVMGTLEEHGVKADGLAAAVVGAGGAGRSAAFGLAHAGAAVTLVNRSAGRGREAADELDLPFLALEELDPADFDLLVHATPLGKGEGDPLPFEVRSLRPGAVVVDMVYRDGPTPLVAAARDAGALAIDGREVLLHQALDQFRLMTGRELPVELGRGLLGLAPPAALTHAGPAAEHGGDGADPSPDLPEDA